MKSICRICTTGRSRQGDKFWVKVFRAFRSKDLDRDPARLFGRVGSMMNWPTEQCLSKGLACHRTFKTVPVEIVFEGKGERRVGERKPVVVSSQGEHVPPPGPKT